MISREERSRKWFKIKYFYLWISVIFFNVIVACLFLCVFLFLHNLVCLILICSLFSFIWFMSLIISNFDSNCFSSEENFIELFSFFHYIWTVLYSESCQLLLTVPLRIHWVDWNKVICHSIFSQGLVCQGNLRKLHLLQDSKNCFCIDLCFNQWS